MRKLAVPLLTICILLLFSIPAETRVWVSDSDPEAKRIGWDMAWGEVCSKTLLGKYFRIYDPIILFMKNEAPEPERAQFLEGYKLFPKSWGSAKCYQISFDPILSWHQQYVEKLKRKIKASASSSSTIGSVSRLDANNLCKQATTGASGTISWETGSSKNVYIDEAKARGYSPESCGNVLGIGATEQISSTSTIKCKHKGKIKLLPADVCHEFGGEITSSNISSLSSTSSTAISLCKKAVRWIGNSVFWEKTARAAPFVRKAKQEDYTPETCAALLGRTGTTQVAIIEDYNKGVNAYNSGDYKTAIKWYTATAEYGFAKAQYNLGAMYYFAEGVPQDYKAAVKWFTLAAEQGFAEAQYNLGAMFSEGQVVPKDYKAAVKWLTLAAEQGFANSQIALDELTQGPTKTATISPIPSTTDIRIIQQHLTDLGYSPGPVDGQMGKKTKDAIAAFQITQSGKAGYKVDDHLITALEAAVEVRVSSTQVATLPQATVPLPTPTTSTSTPTAETAVLFPSTPISIQFNSSEQQPDDIAVIIGNANYSDGRDIPNVTPAYADAEGMRKYVTLALGIAEDNIIFLKDASQKDLVSTFGNESNHKGRLFRYLTREKSRVFVFYSGHGAPGDDDTNYLVPTDAEASLIDLNGYPLKTLYQNLSKLPAKSVTVVLEACFSGASEAGTVINNASPVYLKAKETSIPPNITVITAGASNQIASWEEDKSHGLFTKYFLMGMSGEADNDSDEIVSWAELTEYLAQTVTRFAMRNYGREQTPQIVVGSGG